MPLLLPLLFLSLQVPNTKSTDDATKKKEEVQTLMRGAFKGVPRRLAIDVNLANPVPEVKEARWQAVQDFLLAVGSMMKRELVQLDTGYVLTRSVESTRQASPYWAIAKWLEKVSDHELRALAGPGVAFSDLSPESQAVFRTLCDNPTVQADMLSGNFVAANIRISTLFQVKDRSGKMQESLVDPFVQDSEAEAKYREDLRKTFKPKTAIVWPTEESEGELDFSQGELLSVRDSVAKARSAFKTKFDFDGRTADQMIFWQGRFSKQVFVDYLKKVSIPFEPALSPTDDALLQKNLNDLLKSRIAPLAIASMPSGFDKGDLFGGRTITAGDFSGQNGRWSKLTSNLDVDPTEPISFKPAFAFSGYASPRNPNNIEDHSRARWSVIIRP